MSSIVEISNLALSNLGKENINTVYEASAEARACRQFYDVTRKVLLQSYPWNFAGKTQALAEIAGEENCKWRFSYQRPSDCLKLRWISSLERPADWQAEVSNPHEVIGGTIRCDLTPAFARYTFDLVDPSRFSPLFVDALGWHLAVRLAMPLTRDPKMRADAWQVAQQMTGQAQMADASEQPADYWTRTDLVEGRE